MNIGDLVMSDITGRVGIVTQYIQQDPTYVYVLYFNLDTICSAHISKLTKLEKK